MSIADVLAAKTSAGSQRASFTHAQMDAIGGFDDKNQEIGIVVEIGEDLEAPINDGSTDVLTTELGDETVEDSNPTPMSVMEISEEVDDEESDIDEDLTRLLGDTVASVTQKKQKKGGCCSCKTRIIGNQTIVCGDYFDKTGWGVVGPQWFGPGCVIAIVAWASVHFIRKALGIGPLTTSMCAIFAVATTYNLIDTAFRDPGICMDKVRPANAKNPADYIWCDFCSVFQPPDGAHCPDCNVCVAGYDHHCVWMGTCIGKKNFRQFVRFNLSWIGYLLYAVLWVAVVAPAVYHSK